MEYLVALVKHHKGEVAAALGTDPTLQVRLLPAQGRRPALMPRMTTLSYGPERPCTAVLHYDDTVPSTLTRVCLHLS